MKFSALINNILTAKQPLLAVLIDPDKFNPELISIANNCNVACFLVGGSQLKKGNIKKTVSAIKKISSVPVVLFPGDERQLCANADGLFLPALLSGRNPDYLIGKQILMAPRIRKMKLQHVSMAYLLINGQRVSSTQKITKTTPYSIKNKTQIIHTALAAQQLGYKLLYLEAGSGAKLQVPAKLITEIKKQVTMPLLVGGGINSAQKVKKIISSGANMIVVGNALEKNVYLLEEISTCFEPLK